jgi:hypothetical protein
MCHHEATANPTGASAPRDPHPATVSITRNVSAGPAPLVNQFLLQSRPNADGGPGEIVLVYYPYSRHESQPDKKRPVLVLSHVGLNEDEAIGLVMITGNEKRFNSLPREQRPICPCSLCSASDHLV